MRAILAAVDRPSLHVLFDFYHVQLEEGDVTWRFFSMMDLVDHVQIGNPPDRRQPGVGELEYNHVFSLIRSSGYRGWIGGEFIPSTLPLRHRWAGCGLSIGCPHGNWGMKPLGKKDDTAGSTAWHSPSESGVGSSAPFDDASGPWVVMGAWSATGWPSALWRCALPSPLMSLTRYRLLTLLPASSELIGSPDTDSHPICFD